MENSLIVSYLLHILSVFKKHYKNSYLKYFADNLLNKLHTGKEQSLIISALSGESKLSKKWTESIFYKIITIPLIAVKRLLNYLWNKVNKLICSSMILKAVDRVLSNLFNYSIRNYGALLFAMFAVEAVLWITFQVNELKYIAVRAVLIIVSFVMLLLDIPVAALFKGSFLYRFAEQGFKDSFTPFSDAKGLKANNLPVIMLIGAVLGAIAYVLPWKLFIIAAAAVLSFILILWRYEAGVFLAAGFTALLPTTVMLILIAVTIFSFAFRWAAGKLLKYKATAIDALVVLFFIVLSYSTVTSYFIRDSINVLLVHTLILTFYFVLSRTINSRYKLYLLLALLIISAALTSLYGIYQYYSGVGSSEAWVDVTMFQDIQSRVGSTFNNPNILGEYLILMIPLGLSLLWYRKKPVYKVIFLAMLGIMGISMIYTFSRGAWLGLMLALVVFFIVRDKRLFILFLIALFIMPFALPPSVINRFTSIGNLSDTSSFYRMSILLGSLRMAQDYWLTGIGLGSQAFKAIYPKYSLAEAYALHSHNIYLQVILEMGAAGALVFMLIIFVFLRASLAHQVKTKDAFLSTVMLAASAGIAGYLVQGMVENVWYNYRVLQTFWVVMAIGLCALKLAKEEVKADD